METGKRRERMRDLENSIRAQYDEFNSVGDSLTDEARENVDSWTKELDDLRAEDSHERRTALNAAMQSFRTGGRGIATESGWDDTLARGGSPARRADLDDGLRSLDYHSRSLSKHAGETLETLLREQDEAGVTARYLSAVGDPNYKAAWGKVMRDERMAHLDMTPEEAMAFRKVRAIDRERALSEGSGPSGQYALPFDLDPSVMQISNGVLNPMRDIARVVTTGAYQWRGIVSQGVVAHYQAEASEVTDDGLTFGQPIITPARMSVWVPVSFELFDDWASLQQQLATMVADAKDVAESAAFLNGTGSNEPTGLLAIGQTNALSTSQRVQTATANTLAVGDLYAATQAVPPRWQASAEWAMSKTMLQRVYRLVASASTTEPQIMPDGMSGELVGYDINVWSEMASAVATGNNIAVVGDFSGYTIVDRIGISTEVIQNLFGPNRMPTGQRGFFFWCRNSGGVTEQNAFRYLSVL